MTISVNVPLDVSKTGCQKTVYLSEETTLVHELRGVLSDGQELYPGDSSVTATYAIFKGLRDDGTIVYRPASVEISGEGAETQWTATYTLRRTDVSGAKRLMCSFYIYGAGGSALVTPRFLVCIETALGGQFIEDNVEESEDFSALTEAIATVESLSGIWREDLGVTDDVDEDTATLAAKHKYWWVAGEGSARHPGGRIYALEGGSTVSVTDVTEDMGLERATAREIIDALGIE